MAYIDDVLVMAETEELARDHTKALVFLLEALGFIVHPTKTVRDPSQRLEFLGMTVDSRSMELEVPWQKLKKLRAEATALSKAPTTPTARVVSRLLGKFNAVAQAIAPAPLYCRALQADLAKALHRGDQSYESHCPLSRQAREDLSWWADHAQEWNGKSLLRRDPDLTIESDASRTGWGASSQRIRTGGPWSSEENHLHINCLELLAAFLAEILSEGAIQHTCPPVPGQPNGGVVCKQHGRDSLRPGHTDCQRSLDVVPDERDITVRSASPRGREYDRGRGVEGHEGPLRLDIEQNGVQEDSAALPRLERRSVRFSPVLPTTEVLQLETRPSSRGNRCLSAGLEVREGLCQPAVEPGGKGPSDGGETGSRDSPGRPDLAITTVVPQATQLAGRSYRAPTRPDAGGPGGLPPRGETTPSRVAYLRKQYENKNLSKRASDLLLSSWRHKSAQSYDSLCKRWISWCSERNSDPVSGPVEEVVNFLAHLFEEGYQYRSLNAYRSAIASMHTQVDGTSIGQHPFVSRVLKGAFNSRPPLPRYRDTWDVSKVLSLLRGQEINSRSSLKLLAQRTTMLLALSRPSRSTDLSRLNLKGFRNTPEGVVFLPSDLAKQSRPGKALAEFFFPRFTEDTRLCPVRSLELYLQATQTLRGDTTQLLISYIKPHGPVTSSTVARWLKQVIGDAGIDTSIFKAHSVRAASTSAAANLGISTNEILEAADWSNNSTFQRFYYKPIRNSTFAKAVLSATNNTIDM